MAKKKMKTKKRTVKTGKVKTAKRTEKRPEEGIKSSASIEFCQKCSSILVPVKKGSHNYLKCRSCGTEKKKEVRILKISEALKKRRGVTVLEKNVISLPLTDKTCPRCEHKRSHWWLQQTRSADEPPTQFFRCEKCKYTWREYK